MSKTKATVSEKNEPHKATKEPFLLVDFFCQLSAA